MPFPGSTTALARRRDSVVAVSPIIGGKALKGPADRLLRELGHEPSVVGVARLYAPIAAALVIDPVDAALAGAVEAAGMRPVIAPSVMSTRRGRCPAGAGNARRDGLTEALESANTRLRGLGGVRRAVTPSASVVHGAQPRWMRARTGDTQKRPNSPGRSATNDGGTSPPIIATSSRSEVCTPVPTLITKPAAPLPRPGHGVDDVVDVNEVAGLATVSGEPGRLTVRRGVEQPGDGAPLGMLTRPVHRRHRQRRELDAMLLPVRRQQVDDRLGDDATRRRAA